MSHRETADDYDDIVAQLSPTLRVIVCADDYQWILQYKKATWRDWRSYKFCTSRDGVIRRVKEAGYAIPDAIANLPDRFKSVDADTLARRRGAKSDGRPDTSLNHEFQAYGGDHVPRKWIKLGDIAADLASRRQPTQRESDKYGVYRKRPQPPRIGRGDDRLREDDRPDDRYDERDPDGENDE